jgi:hypothetical protein
LRRRGSITSLDHFHHPTLSASMKDHYRFQMNEFNDVVLVHSITIVTSILQLFAKKEKKASHMLVLFSFFTHHHY